MSQRAILLQEVGKPLVVGSRPIPQPGKDQLLVKVLVAGRKFANHSVPKDKRTIALIGV